MKVEDFLRRAGLGEPIRMEALAGGVSSDIWRVELAGRTICVKRALPRLRVTQVWEAPIERNRYERQWLQVAREAAPSSAPQVLAWDDEAGVFAMEHLAFPVWKSVLREGHADAAFAAQVGERLAAIHNSTRDAQTAQRFPTDDIFYAIRLEPYLVATAPRHPDLAEELVALARRTAATRECLVHGDVSPKNILVGAEGPAQFPTQFPIFLDAECAWYGDPAFDLAFCLNHMFLKCIWVPAARDGFLRCYDALSSAYLSRIPQSSRTEERAATLLPGLLLGRIDGKSPVEYLDEAQRALVRSAARKLLQRPSATLGELRDAWRRYST
jgi:aminoglycoside phosphotransferase (APT) family kinase protein